MRKTQAALRRKGPRGKQQQKEGIRFSQWKSLRYFLIILFCVLIILFCAIAWFQFQKINEGGYKKYDAVLPWGLPPSISETVTPCPIRHNFPQFNATSGGVVFFFHIPKTGGSSIWDQLKRLAKSHPDSYKTIYFDERSYKASASIKSIDEYLENPDPTIQLTQFHGIHPTFSDVYERISHWRLIAARKNVPFFVFSVVRDPFITALSTFNFFCFELRQYTKCQANATSDHLMKLVKPDPQTRWLCKTSLTFESNYTIPAEPTNVHSEGSYYPVKCPNLQGKVAAQMDWMGRLENFDETVSLLQNVGIPIVMQKKNPTQRKHILLKQSDLSNTEIQTIRNSLKHDSDLYRFSERCFQGAAPN